MVRVSKRGMITTPNKFFPFEIHTRTFLMHYMKKDKFDKFLEIIGKKWASKDYMNLLSIKTLKLLIEKAGIKNYS